MSSLQGTGRFHSMKRLLISSSKYRRGLPLTTRITLLCQAQR